jgi:hypothetical protein
MFTVFSPSESVACLRQILDESQLVYRALASELHGVHGLPDEVQSQSAWAYFFERPPLELVRVNRWTAVKKQYFEPLLDLPIVSALRLSKVHRDWLVKPIAVRMSHDVGQTFIDRASDQPALLERKSQSFGQAINRASHYREPLGIAVQGEHHQQTSWALGLWLMVITRDRAWKNFRLRHARPSWRSRRLL